MSGQHLQDDIYDGLHQLAEAAFPKRCRQCGREYKTSAEFLAATRPLRPDTSGLKLGHDEEGHEIVELFRNCVCGSTLLESYWNRRDLSDKGLLRRKHFKEMMDRLMAGGCPAETARTEMLKFIHSQPNNLPQLMKRHLNGKQQTQDEQTP